MIDHDEHRPITGPTPLPTDRAAWTGFIIGILAIFICVLLYAGKVRAHEAQSGWQYPARCCWSPQTAPAGRRGDCDEIPDHAVRAVEGGYIVSLVKGDHPMVSEPITFTVAYEKAEHSVDGKFHVCFASDMKPRCFFAPRGMS